MTEKETSLTPIPEKRTPDEFIEEVIRRNPDLLEGDEIHSKAVLPEGVVRLDTRKNRPKAV